MRRPKKKTATEYKRELKELYDQKSELIKQRIELENTILRKEGSVIYVGYTYTERLTGQLSKTLTDERRYSILDRVKAIRAESKKPYNKFYVARLGETKDSIRQIDGKIQYIKKRLILCEQMDGRHENEPITVKDFIGKENYSDMTEDERQAFKRAKKRREEELRKMELGLPPYDKIKIKNFVKRC